MDNFTYTQNYTGNAEPIFYKWLSFACGVILIPVAIFGIIGNTITVCIFCRQNMASSINTLLVGLAVFDLWLLLTATPMFSTLAISALHNSDESRRVVAFLTLYIYPLSAMAQSASAWTMIVISVERYLAVCRPFVAMVVCTVKRAVVALGVVLFTAVLYNACRFFEYRPDSTAQTYMKHLLRSSAWYIKIYINWSYLAFMFILPFGVLVALNTRVILSLRKAKLERQKLRGQETNEHKTALMMVIVMVIFLLCNFLALALNAIETFNENLLKKYDFVFFLLSDFNNVLVEINSSINCVVYYYFSQKFRLAFGQLFCSSNMSKSTMKNSVTFEMPLSTYCNHDSLTEHSLLLVNNSIPSRKNTLVTTMGH